MNLVPGKSLGQVSMGERLAELLKKGFLPDTSRSPDIYLKKDLLLVRLQGERVVQIWFMGNTFTMLRLHQRKFPKQNDPKTLRKFFKACESDVRGSGGILIYCENRGIELAYSHERIFQGLSVVTHFVAEQTVHPNHL